MSHVLQKDNCTGQEGTVLPWEKTLLSAWLCRTVLSGSPPVRKPCFLSLQPAPPSLPSRLIPSSLWLHCNSSSWLGERKCVWNGCSNSGIRDLVSQLEVKVLVTQMCPTISDPVDEAPLSMEFSRQQYWSGLPFLSPGDLPNTEIKPGSPALQADSLPSEPPGKPLVVSRVTTYLYNLGHVTSPFILRSLTCKIDTIRSGPPIPEGVCKAQWDGRWQLAL